MLCLLACLLATQAPAAERATIEITDKPAAPQGSLDGRIFGYSGGIWHVPRTFPWIAPDILKLKRLGTVRVALAWEVLAASQSLEDLERRLIDYPLNDFLKQAVARGGRVLVCLDAMPRWLASDRSEERLADGPAWAKSAPRDFDAWRRVVQAVVHHFNRRLGLNAGYEIWNEPDHAFRGTLEQYFALYRASVAGALAADPNAKVGGPALSDWTARGTRGTPGSYQEGFFFQRFFAYAARTPLPEFKRQRLPIDFVSWHSFYRDPSRHYEFLVPQLRGWLGAAGYPSGTPLLVSEWNIAAEPPYPEGDLNGSHVGAAYLVSNLIAMHQSGIASQVFQMLVDPGGAGYSGGSYTYPGLPRPGLNAFRMAMQLEGRALETRTSDPWIRSIASLQGDTLYVLVGGFLPTERTLLRSATEELALGKADTATAIARVDGGALLAYFRDGRSLSGKLSDADIAVLDAARTRYREAMSKAERWKSGVALEVRWPAGVRPTAVRRLLVDGQHSASPQKLAELDKSLLAALKRSAEAQGEDLRRRGGAGLQKNFLAQIQRDFGNGPVSAANDQEVRALKGAIGKLHADYRALLETARSDPALQLAAEPVALSASATSLSIAVPPNSAQLLVFQVAR